ncbi:MAG: dihydroorotate dehydrogenase-like protein [Bacteroidales bacterium]|jgi:dihydroorotate dehydrogenase (fumarate)|nr:dihydroorotate dehydrogenase-like protein [Bacteroidales bacterium]
MTDISTNYLGLRLKSPIIAGSSDFTASADKIAALAKAGAGAVVLKSIFEEQILMEIDAQRTNNMFNSYTDTENYISFYTRQHEVQSYLKLIREAKERVDIPVIASVHCSVSDSWVSFSKDIELAGADAIELNIFIMPSDVRDTDADISGRYMAIVDAVKKNTSLPVALKVHHYFTGMANFLVQLSEKSEGLVLFNRFFNPDINISTLTIGAGSSFSLPEENGMVQRWTGILRPHVKGSLAATTGIHDGEALVKNLLAGADAVQIATALYKTGPEAISQMNNFLTGWMQQHGFTSLIDFRGKLSYAGVNNPALYERAQFMKYFSDLGR